MRVFVSHAGKDRAWAEWAAWHLRQSGYDVEVDLEWGTGADFAARMQRALQECTHMVALYSTDYFVEDSYSLMELRAWLARPERGAGLIPLRVADVQPPNLYRPYVWADLFGLPDEKAQPVLLSALSGGTRTSAPPALPGADAGPRVPGSVPAVFSVPQRNPNFVGRDDLLVSVHDRLAKGERTVVQALHGWGGVGKTQLAAEYAHRFANEYDLVWWIDAEQPELMGDQVASLAVAAGVARPDTPAPEAAAAVKEHLRSRSRWLLVFDNAERPDDIRLWLPGGSGHVIITSRYHAWAGVASAVQVDVFSRAESVALLVGQTGMTAEQANDLAENLGDLPLAVAQAAGLILSTGMPVRLYLTMLGDHALRTLGQNKTADYPVPLAASISMSLQRLAETDPVALAMVRIAALLAPEPLPVEWFLNPPAEKRPPALRTVDAARLYQAAGVLGGLGIARPLPEGLLLHRLTQAVIADSLTDAERAEAHDAAVALVVATGPDNETNPQVWPVWQSLLPHLLALDPAASTNHDLRWTGMIAVWYQANRGDRHPALALAQRLHTAWQQRLGPDHADTLAVADSLADVHRRLGQYAAARTLQEQTLTARRRVLGDEAPATLAGANNLGGTLRDLGDHAAARTLLEQTLATQRRVLGDEHPATLASANNLAVTLRDLGDHAAARTLHEHTLATQRRVLGDEHPDTLTSANNLAHTLRDLGEHTAARTLHEQTLATRRRVLGDEHPDTLQSAGNLALTLRDLGETEAAAKLEAWVAEVKARRQQG